MAGAQVRLYLNDSSDDGCGFLNETITGTVNSPICNVRSVAELRTQGVQAGTMVINGNGSFINGGLSIGGAFDLGANQIHALKAGTASTDAVNVGQLSSILRALGGDVRLDAVTGAVSDPRFDLANGGAQITVGGALGSLDGAITNNRSSIASLESLISQDPLSRTISIGGMVDGDTVDLASKDNGRTYTRRLTGLSEGALSSTSTDAVNGAQLHATNQQVAINTGSISLLQSQIGNGTVGLVLQDALTQDISVGSVSGGGRVSFTGADGDRVLSGLRSGTADSDAVTVAQLKASGLVDPNGVPLAALVYDDLTLGSATLGGAGGTVIRNLADGAVAAGSMEAVNGGQLYQLRFDLVSQIDALNGRIDALQPQTIDRPVAAKDPAGHGGDTLGTGAIASGTDSTALGSHSVASGNDAVAVGANSIAARDHTVSVGSAGNERQITHVAAGIERTDAANWGQVQDAVQEVRHWVRDRFRQAGRLANAGTAAAMAMTNVPQAYAADQSALGAGIGSFKGQSALALGLSTITPGGRWVVKGSLTGNTQGDVGVGMGAALIW
ncbi:YadA-like family protein [Dyella marensis]|jgi:autotransporter adhesin|uniref:Coiled stalk of trimeric autotransporter adhesin n=1 Tax=Dyella marensis TaxID=500610 RepID=A0A1I2I8S1_9GAMM|nr:MULTISPECIES: YadA-like family protein [Dyella]SFF37980.1 Coiled stalk of trimeric autotransporter adhesin [Dyella marensis]